MKIYLLKILSTVIGIIFCHYLIVFFVKSPIPAEYWLREFIIAKRCQANAMPSPKIIFIGGSSGLFGINAAEVQKSLRIPAVNFGLHAAMRLEDHLNIARELAKPGDILILTLEPVYFDTYTEAWDAWDLRNTLAWNRSSFEALPLKRRFQIIFQASDPTISWDLLETKFTQNFFPADIKNRMEALAPEQTIIARYLAEVGTSQNFAFTVSNLDSNGDLMHATDNNHPYRGSVVALTRPASISPYANKILAPFLAEMKTQHIRVFFDYTPYLIYGTPDPGWKSSSNTFESDLHRIGGELLEERDAFFYPSTYFFNTSLHLNEKGREVRTQSLIEALRKKI